MGHPFETCRNHLCRRKLTGQERFCPRCSTPRVAPVKKSGGLALVLAFAIVIAGTALMVLFSASPAAVVRAPQPPALVERVPTLDNSRQDHAMTVITEMGEKIKELEKRPLPHVQADNLREAIQAALIADAEKFLKQTEQTTQPGEDVQPTHVSPQIRIIEKPMDFEVARAPFKPDVKGVDTFKPVTITFPENKTPESKPADPKPEVKVELRKPAEPLIGSIQNWNTIAQMVQQNQPVGVTRVRELLGDPAEISRQAGGLTVWIYRPAGTTSKGTIILERNAVKSITLPQFSR